MKSNVLRFEQTPVFNTGKSAMSAEGDTSPDPEMPKENGFHAPLPIIEPSFLENGRDSTRRAANTATTSEVSSALEKLPHLLHKIQALWGSRDLNTFIAHLLMDSRDGSRAGFPVEVAQELLFLAKTNLILRAQDAAPLLGISLVKAVELIAEGDQAAQGHSRSADDIWAQHVAVRAPSVPRLDFAAGRSSQRSDAPRASAPSIRLTPFITEHPPLPQAVRVDITSPVALRSARGGLEPGGIMDYGLFRCLAKELGSLHISRLVLSSLGDSTLCKWLPDGLRFAHIHCRFNSLVLQVDLLSSPEDLLCQCIYHGTDHLVIYLNQASNKWRTQAQAVCANDPDYFRREIARLVAFRDEIQATSGQRCEISVIHAGKRAKQAMAAQFHDIEYLPGLVHFDEVDLPPGIRKQDVAARGRCYCLSPFIEAHVRTNGHLVACAMDHSGYSFTADLTTTGFMEAWNSQAFRMVRQRVAQGEKAGRLCEICPHHTMTSTAPGMG